MQPIQTAASITVAVCKHGNIHFELLGSDDAVIAVAHMSAKASLDLLDDLGAKVEEAIEIVLTTAAEAVGRQH